MQKCSHRVPEVNAGEERDEVVRHGREQVTAATEKFSSETIFVQLNHNIT